MKASFLVATLLVLGLCPASHATLAMWQAEVAAGTAPAATEFTTISAPVMKDVGALIGDRSFEFIFNANAAAPNSVSSALMGSQVVASGRQGLKYEQWQDTGFFGATAFGVVDVTSAVPVQDNVDLHVVFASNGTDTAIYLNGSLADTMAGFALALTGNQALGAARNGTDDGYFDVLVGNIYGFASYDSALSAGEVLSHYNAFAAIPEPASAGLIALTSLAWLGRRRRI